MKKLTILVAGGAGYIGSHMVKELLRENFQVITVDNLSTGNRHLLPGGTFIKGDLGNQQLLDNIFTQYVLNNYGVGHRIPHRYAIRIVICDRCTKFCASHFNS